MTLARPWRRFTSLLDASGREGGSSQAQRTGSHRFGHQPALDGIRALAVSAVLVFHGHLPWGGGGFLGVEAFFVLSGYLITSLLLSEWDTAGRIDILAFWSRRARRLLPAVFLLMLGIAGYALVFATPQELDNLRGDAIATLGGVSNWRMVSVGHVYYTPLGHAWSLGVEQQWYLVWPFIIFALLRFGRGGSPRILLFATIALAAASALLMARLYEPGAVQVRAAYGTDTRAQSLLVGGALAILLSQSGPVRNVAGAVALQLLAVGMRRGRRLGLAHHVPRRCVPLPRRVPSACAGRRRRDCSRRPARNRAPGPNPVAVTATRTWD